MEIKRKKIQSFADLLIWQQGHKLVLMVYRLTDKFPVRERYSLTDQLRRAVVSITNNIAEGFSRQGYKEKTQFYYMALGSLTEVKNQLLIARDLKYMEIKLFNRLIEQTLSVHKLLNRLITVSKSKV